MVGADHAESRELLIRCQRASEIARLAQDPGEAEPCARTHVRVAMCCEEPVLFGG